MQPTAGVTRPRKPQERVRVNSERILDAGTRLLAADGWRKLSYLAVATESGLTRRSVSDRHEDLPSLAVAIWQQRCEPALAAAIDELLQASDLESMTSALTAFYSPDAELAAATELLVQSQFTAPLARAIAGSLAVDVTELLTSSERNPSPADLGRNGYLLIVALGLLLTHRAIDLGPIDVRGHADRLLQALAAQERPVQLPEPLTAPTPAPLSFDTGDPVLDLLLAATVNALSNYGFEDSNLDEIAADAGFTKGALFSRYGTKLELVRDAIKRASERSIAAGAQFMAEASARYGRGIGEALHLRFMMSPAYAQRRTFVLEELRILHHHDAIREQQSQQLLRLCAQLAEAEGLEDGVELRTLVYFAVAIGNGNAILPLLFEQAYQLPFEVMTVPIDRLVNG